MDIYRSMRVFVEVAKQNGFAPAARALESSTSSVSRQIIELEEWLGVTLFQRTTRKLSLTDEGLHYLQECQKIVEDIARVKQTANEALPHPKGKLRLTAPVFLAKECLINLIPEFIQQYPEIELDITAVDRFVDLVEEGFDLALRIGELPDSTLIARKLMDIKLVIAASPAYLESHGTPVHAADLKHHNCIVDTVASFSNRWPIKAHDNSKYTAVSGNVTVNNGEVARNLSVKGMGVVLLPQFFVQGQLDNGELVEVLPGEVASKGGVYAVYPQNKHLTARVRAFVDFAVGYFDT